MLPKNRRREYLSKRRKGRKDKKRRKERKRDDDIAKQGAVNKKILDHYMNFFGINFDLGQESIWTSILSNNSPFLLHFFLVEKKNKRNKKGIYQFTNLIQNLSAKSIANELECKTRDTFGDALFNAVKKKDIRAANDLLDSVKNPDVNRKKYNYWDSTLIFLAIYNGDIKMVDLLIKYGADLKIFDKKGETVLHIALREGQYDIALLLLDKGALEIINKQNNDGNTPLMVGIGMISQNTLLLSMLIDKGADISIKNNEGDTALSSALKYRKESEIISMLKKYSIGKI